jgi:hypothetical protein
MIQEFAQLRHILVIAGGKLDIAVVAVRAG